MELCSELVAYWQPGKILSGSGLGTLAVVIEPDSAAGAGHIIGKHPRRGGHPVLKQTGAGSDNHGSEVDSSCSVDNCGQFIRQAVSGELRTLYPLARTHQELLCAQCCRTRSHRR